MDKILFILEDICIHGILPAGVKNVVNEILRKIKRKEIE